jgi:hypothetical protein
LKQCCRKELGSSLDYFVCLISQNALLSSLKLKKNRKKKRKKDVFEVLVTSSAHQTVTRVLFG